MSKSKNSNKTILIIGVILLVVVLAAGTYFAFAMPDQKNWRN